MSDDPENKERLPRPRFRPLKPETPRVVDTEVLVARVLEAAEATGLSVPVLERQWNPLVTRPQPIYWGRLS